MKQASGMSEKTSQMILAIICGIVLFIVAYPLYYVVVASFSDPYEVYAGKTFLFPSGFTLDGYKGVFLNDGIVSGFLNSVKYTVIGTIFSVVMEDRAIERLTDLDQFWMPYVEDTTFYPVDCVFTGMEMETIDWHKADLESAVREQEGLWIKEGGPTDAEWQAYKDRLSKKCGLDDLIQVYQDAYDRYAAAK